MSLNTLLLAGLASTVSAVRLYATTYAGPNAQLGTVQSLDFVPGLAKNAGQLKALSQNTECGSAPTWLDHTLGGNLLYCVDEGWQTPNASINTLTINADGSLKRIAELPIIQGPVSTQFYNGNKALALAHYGGSAISTYTISEDRKTFVPLQNFTFNTPKGPRPEQEASHPHHAVLDPKGQFMVFPDLGSDIVRVYRIDSKTNLLTAHEGIKTKPAYGPRHAAFWSPTRTRTQRGGETYLFVVNELANRVTSYKVTYGRGGPTFTEVQDIGLYGDREDPVGTRAAEIAVSPDNAFVTTSNRNATIFQVANPDASNSTKVPSDSFTVFKPSANGKLSFVQLAPSGGSFPRHFSYNEDGSLVAVGNQNSQDIAIWARDVKTGKFGERVAAAKGFPGQVSNVIWG